MQIFFVVDKVDKLDEKISALSNVFDAEFKFLVPTSIYTKINTNQFVIEHLAGVYDGSINKKIDEYIKSEKFTSTNVLLYYSSADLTIEQLKQIENKIKYRYDAIYVSKKTSKVKNFFKKFYLKVIEWMFRVKDAVCSTKVQYLSTEFINYLKEVGFNSHILEAENSDVVVIEDKIQAETLKTKIKIKKYNIGNLIAFFIVLILYIVFANLFALKFWIHFMFIMLILLEIALAIMLIINNIFHDRFKK